MNADDLGIPKIEDDDDPLAEIYTQLHRDWDPETQDNPPLELAVINGVEGVSIPYAYEVTLFCHEDNDDIDPSQLIGTPCAISIRNFHDYDINTPGGPRYVIRKGVFEHFQSVRTAHVRDHRIYRGRVVPAFKLLARQTRYRTFEHKSVRAIIEQCLRDVPHLALDLSRLEAMKEFGSEVDYCAQIGESTFDFVHRIMAQYGLWYYFEHGTDTDLETGSTLVVGSTELPNWEPEGAMQMPVWLEKNEPGEKEGHASVYNFTLRYEPVPDWTLVGNFNPLVPIQPIEHTRTAYENYRLIDDGGTASLLQQSLFPEPILSRQEPERDAKNHMTRKESEVYRVTADSNNTTFMAGRTFLIYEDKSRESEKDEDLRTNFIFGQGNKPIYLITRLDFLAIVGDVGWGILDAIGGFLTGLATGIIGAVSSGGADATAGTLASILKGALANSVPGETSYRSSLEGVPWCRPDYTHIPQVKAPRPFARGPHLAVVIGREGNEPSDGSDVHADALGRVRVRFPWDPGPVSDAEPMRARRWSTSEGTCWAQVVNTWAGRGFGAQFLPRIGQQVLVDYIDGDPDRPIVVGGVYSASNGMTELPFPRGQHAEQVGEEQWRHPRGSDGFKRSGIKTKSMPYSGEERFHLLRLDDTDDHEQFVLRSQGRLDLTSFDSHYETSCGDRHTLVGDPARQAENTGGNWLARVGGEYDLRVEQDRLEEVGEDYQLHVKRETNLLFDGNLTAGAGKGASLGAGTITLSAADKITLKVGGSAIVLTPGGIHIDGPMVYINCGGSGKDAGGVELKELKDPERADPGED